MQVDLFATGGGEHSDSFEVIPVANADIKLGRSWLGVSQADALYQYFCEAISWEQPTIAIAGQLHPTPRLQAWFGDTGTTYGYSGRSFEPQPWSAELSLIKNKVEQACGGQFNSVLVNWYRNGQDSVGWHADDEPELGSQPVIASLSLGSSRRFLIRPKAVSVACDASTGAATRRLSTGLDLHSGDLLLMAGETQYTCQHSVPKTRKLVGGRINLTFRHVIIGGL